MNIVGYLDESTGVGELARGLVRAFRLAGVPVAEVGLDAGGSLRRAPAGGTVPNPHSTNIVCVNADQVGRVAEVVGRQFFAGRFNVGYWAWELPEFPRHWRSAFEPFDEIWAPSRFVKDAVAKVAPIPVTVVPPALAPAAAQATERAALGLDTDAIVFLAMFDHRSFAERKNPLGAIEAFGRAFGSGEGQRPGVQLIIKAGGASFAPSAHEKVEAAAEAVSARLLTAPMTRDEVNGLVAAADCFVSLHQSEGFGLPLAEAMGAGKPVIATDYPANAEFQTPDNSLLVAAGRRVLTEPVGPYPRGAVWAEPDIDQAASWMRWVADHPADARQIGARAAADVRRQFSARAVAQGAIERLRQATSDSWWDRFLPVGPDSGPADDVPTASSQEQRPTAGPLVNVVLADTGWILERCARELESRLPYVRVASAAEPTAAINYYMNYSAWRGEPAGRKAAFFTHVEERVPEAARRFFDVAREMDVAVAMSDRYADQLRQAGVGRVEVIVPGVDLQRFRPSLRIGVVGRTSPHRTQGRGSGPGGDGNAAHRMALHRRGLARAGGDGPGRPNARFLPVDGLHPRAG